MNKLFGGASVFGGCLLVIVLAVACGVVGGIPAASLVDNKLAADRAKAEAQLAREEQARIDAEAAKIETEAMAAALADYSQVSQYALYADIRKAHPELFWRNLVKWAVMAALLILAVSSAFVAVRVALLPTKAPALLKNSPHKQHFSFIKSANGEWLEVKR